MAPNKPLLAVAIVSLVASTAFAINNKPNNEVNIAEEKLYRTMITPKYIKDARTELCFATISHGITGTKSYSFSFTNVPCTQVEKFLEK